MTHRAAFDYRLLILAAICLALAACAAPTRPGPAGARPPLQAAQQSAAQGDYARAAELYMRAAQQQSDPAARNALHLEAGIAAARAGRIDMADQILSSVQPANLSQADYRRYELARTEVRIGRMSPAQALAQLPPPQGGTPPAIAARIWKKRAELLFAQYKYAAGIHNLVQRGVWLVDEQAIRQNNQLIYRRAQEAVAYGQGSQSPAARNADATTRGWLELAEIGQRGLPQGPALARALNAWENRYIGHPATRHLLLEQFNYKPYSSPRRGVSDGPVALALPLSGDFAAPATAIREGFKMGRARSPGSRPVRVYDTSDMSARDILQKARADGISLIVGPLKKDKVLALARLGIRIPTLALNQVENMSAPPSFYQYALAPEDDARAVAQRAAGQGWRRAIALVPEGDWGTRVLAAFQDAFTRRGGQLVDYASFNTDQYDHQQAIQAVLRGYHSGVPVDFVFIAAQPVHARLLRSQLRFYRAGGLPVLATSHAYTGQPDPRNDIDLNGVAFAGIPWIIGQNAALERARQRAAARPGTAAERYPSLFAMGLDAWRLTEQLIDGGLPPGTTLDGTTGILEVRRDGRIQRHLAWARFVDGRPRLIATPSLDRAPGTNPGWRNPTPVSRPGSEPRYPAEARPADAPRPTGARPAGARPAGMPSAPSYPQY